MVVRYVELVIEGRRGWALGFLEGFVCARGLEARVLDAEAEGFDCQPLREQLRELLHPSTEILHLLVPEEMRSAIREAVTAGAAFGRAIVERHARPLSGARFEFSVAVFSPEHAAQIREIFEVLPAGVSLTPPSPFREIVDPAAAGVELYAPAHAYQFRGQGVIEGSLDGVLALYRICRDDPLIAQRPAELVPG